MKVKIFETEMPNYELLEDEINGFIESGKYALVKVEISTIMTVMKSHMMVACVTYEEAEK